jgi:hypothetical protein
VTKLLNLLGRGIGALSGALLAVCWTYVMWVPAAGLHLSGVSFIVALLLALAGLFSVIAAVRGHSLVLVLAFVASFFPIGVTLLQVDHWLRWAGWLDIGLLAGGVLMWLTTRDASATATTPNDRS